MIAYSLRARAEAAYIYVVVGDYKYTLVYLYVHYVYADPHPTSPLEDKLMDNFTLCLPGSEKKFPVSARTLSRWRIREIGRGRYGTVDIMREPISGFQMAVKVSQWRRQGTGGGEL